MEIILSIFWFMLPAGVANMSPVLFKWTNFLNKPVDFGFKVNGKYLFGRNKTYRGFFFGTLMAIFVVWLQVILVDYTKEFSLIDYKNINIFLTGFLLGFGALLGDLVESFLKRRVGIESGKSWPVFDQIDWVVGALLLFSFIKIFSWDIYLYIVLFWGLAHPIVNLIGYWLGIKKNKF